MKKTILMALAALCGLPGLAQTEFRSMTCDEAVAAARAEGKMVFMDFYTDWCGPCKEISPIIKRLAKKYRNEIVVYKVDVDAEKELAAMFGIRSIPTLVFLPMKGNPFQSVGMMPDTERHLESLITDSLLRVKK